MVTRIRKLIFLFLVVGIAAAIVALNLEPITVYYSPSGHFTAIGGIVILGLFAAGIALAAVFWVFFGIKAYFRERSLQNKEKGREQFYRAVLEARSYLEAHDWGKARELWQRIIKKDQTNIIAHVELSRCLQGAGEIKEALKTIESARVADPNNVEVLFRAAELNLDLHNNTGAIDNLALILYHQPNRKAAALARDLSEELGRIEDALEYHSKLESLGENSEAQIEIRTRLLYKKLLADNEDESTLSLALKKFIKKHPHFVPAMEELSSIEISGSD